MISKITLACVVTLTALITQRREETMNKLTPVILVEEIEPCLDFWTSLGFERTAEVPGDGTLAFVSLQLGNVEIMYQSRTSVLEDMPALAGVSRALRDRVLHRSGRPRATQTCIGSRRDGGPRTRDVLRDEGDRSPLSVRHGHHVRPAAIQLIFGETSSVL